MNAFWPALALLLPGASFAARGDGFVLAGESLKGPVERTLEIVERAHRLGATHFTIPVGLCQRDKTSSEIAYCPDYDKTRTTVLAGELKTRGFSFTFFPFLNSGDGVWRGQFEPKDFGAWSKAYAARLDEIAELAERAGAAEFLVASEMSSLYLAHPDFWRHTLERFQRRFKRIPVFVVANWDQCEKILFWDASDYVGVSAYFPLADSKEADTSVIALASRWRPWAEQLRTLSVKVGRPLYFNEVGYLSRRGAAYQPWGPEPPHELDLGVQARLFEAFKLVWGGDAELERILLWALADPGQPFKDSGYSVLGKPAEAQVSALFAERAKARGESAAKRLDVVFTLDDVPMWFVSDIDERLEHYKRLRETLARHRVPAVVFVNAGGIRDPREWEELKRWKEAGIVFGNHTFSHLPRSTTTEADFLADVDADTKALDEHLPGWDRPVRFFRYPNLDAGSEDKLGARGFRILPVGFDTRDWSLAPKYQPVSGKSLESRPEMGAPARLVAEEQLRTIDSQLERVRESPAILMIHSTRLTRDYLDHILTRLELRGVRWVAPD